MEDDNQPEQVGKFLFWKCPQSIWTLVTDKTRPTDPKKAKIPVMDYLFGRSIDLTVTPGEGKPGDEKYGRDTKYTGEISYRAVCCLAPETTMTRIIVKTLVKIPARIMVNNGLYHVYPFNCLGYVIKSGYFSDI